MGDVRPRSLTPNPLDPDRFIERTPLKIPRRLDWRPRVLQQLKVAPWWYGFQNADKVIICLKRKIRREVMNALGLAGKKGQKSPHFNAYSHIRC